VSETAGGAGARTALVGVGFGLIAHLVWGLSPIYFKAVQHVPVWELLAHRVAWSAAALALLTWALRRGGPLRRALADPAMRRTLAITTVLIATNWFLYMYAVVTDRVLHASLGYFMSPLANILMGRIFLKERMSPVTKVAVALAGTSILLMAWDLGALPWISLLLPISFGFYALLRKTAPVDPMTGLLVETWIMLPVACAFFLWAHALAPAPYGQFGRGLETTLLLPITGFVTVVPLLSYVASSKRLTLTAVGFMQYLAPTMQMLLGWLAYDEPMSPVRGAAFIVVWVGLALFTANQVRLANARRRDRWTRRAASA
jgi:chloramphenicol-sensitive protein RarD